jgi:hypothetical protein
MKYELLIGFNFSLCFSIARWKGKEKFFSVSLGHVVNFSSDHTAHSISIFLRLRYVSVTNNNLTTTANEIEARTQRTHTHTCT